MSRFLIIVPIVAALAVAGTKLETATPSENPTAQAQGTNGAVVKVKAEKVEEAEPYVKQMLMLMDRDQNGKVSREEFMAFMAAEFDRMDKNHDGELDVKELTQIRMVHGGGHR